MTGEVMMDFNLYIFDRDLQLNCINIINYVFKSFYFCNLKKFRTIKEKVSIINNMNYIYFMILILPLENIIKVFSNPKKNIYKIIF